MSAAQREPDMLINGAHDEMSQCYVVIISARRVPAVERQTRASCRIVERLYYAISAERHAARWLPLQPPSETRKHAARRDDWQESEF